MKLFLDTEFNGFRGELLSMALVPEDLAEPVFYQELPLPTEIHPWVKDNVVPHMTQKPVTKQEFQALLMLYLKGRGEVTIVADWPEDIRHFCESLIVSPGYTIAIYHKINFELDMNLPYVSDVPHNAYHDAVAIRTTYLAKQKK
jgi:hypothetical protein